MRALAGSGKRAPNLVDLAGIHSMTRDARALYSSAEAAELMSAVAILVSSVLSRAMSTFFLGMNKPIMPTRVSLRRRRPCCG